MEQLNHSHTILVAAPGLKKSSNIDVLKQESSYNLIYAASASAIEKQISSGAVDLILLELDLPDLNTTDLIIKVRSVDTDIPIIVLGDSRKPRIGENLWNAGIDDGICKPLSAAELSHRVARSLKLRRLSRFCSKLERENKGLWQLSITDGLTKLLNRRHFNELLRLEFSRAARFGGTLGCIMADIDHFKSVNDTHGHLTGDRILRELSVLLRANIRKIDFAARYGGEEFVFLLPETEGEGLVFVAEKLRQVVEENDFRDSENPNHPGPEHITISLGVASYPKSGITNPDELVERADQALYTAKRTGRNKVVLK